MGAKHRIVIAGAGWIGSAVGLLLAEWGAEWGELDAALVIGDSDPDRARAAAEWIRAGSTRGTEVRPLAMPAEGSDGELDAALRDGHVLLDCLPWPQAVRMARLAREHGLHYANLTEHVESSDEIARLAADAERGFVIQTGLAPGFIDVLGHRLFREFCRRYRVDRVESLRLRVGALPVRALPPHYYAFTWNTKGVATEYLEESVVVRGGQRTLRPSLSESATLHLGALVLEEALTSGGAADLPTALAGRVDELDYKTLRHPGHWAWVREQVAALPEGGDRKQRIARLEAAMLRSIPSVERDQVVIYAAVEGVDAEGVRRRLDEHLVVEPRTVGRHTLKAIQCTTAAGLAESARLLLSGALAGVVLQSDLDPDRWLSGPFVRRGFYGD